MPTNENSAPIGLSREIIQAASEGDAAAVRHFFEALLNSNLYVPERFQQSQMSHSPQYPNDFVNILGVQDKERVVVPVFTEAPMIEEWSGQTLAYKTLSTAKFLELLPAGWWFCINPGQDIEKEISPWEADKLRGGIEYINEILMEMANDELGETLELSSVKGDEYAPLQKALIDAAESSANIDRLYILKEKSKTQSGTDLDTVIIGVEINTLDAKKVEEMQNTVKTIVDPHLVGAAQSRVLVGSGGTVTMGIFSKTTPLYTKDGVSPHGLLSKIIGLFHPS